jgi:hypothetical protein
MISPTEATPIFTLDTGSLAAIENRKAAPQKLTHRLIFVERPGFRAQQSFPNPQ